MQTIPTVSTIVMNHVDFVRAVPCWVSVYKSNRHYGGPEEGGWFYTRTHLVGSVPFPTRLAAEAYIAAAEAHVAEMQRFENSKFRSSSFSKGVIYYSKFQSITYEQAPSLLNFTANSLALDEVFYEEPGQESFIRITDSTFKNMAFQRVIQALYKREEDDAYSTKKFVEDIVWRRYMD